MSIKGMWDCRSIKRNLKEKGSKNDRVPSISKNFQGVQQGKGSQGKETRRAETPFAFASGKDGLAGTPRRISVALMGIKPPQKGASR